MTRGAAAVLVLSTVMIGLGAWSASAAARPVTQTLVFDTVARGSFVDQPPAEPSPGDVEADRKAARCAWPFRRHRAHRCVFTKVIPNYVLELCSGSAKTSEGTVSLGGVGHLYSMNPPWQVTGRSGAYKGLHGKQVFATDIPLDPTSRWQLDVASASR